VFVRRSTHLRELELQRIEMMIASRSEGIVPSGEAIEGLRRQLLFALPRTRRGRRLGSLRRQLGGRRPSVAYNRMASVFMAAYGGQEGIGQFEVFRRAVIEAAGDRRTRLNVLVEVHHWLSRNIDSTGVLSQLETRLEEQGILIVSEPAKDYRSDDRFVCHGKGDVVTVDFPAYIVDIEDREVIVRQGHLECKPREDQQQSEVERQETKVEEEVSDGDNRKATGQGAESINGRPDPIETDNQNVKNIDSVTDGELDAKHGDTEAHGEFNEDIDEVGNGGKEQ